MRGRSCSQGTLALCLLFLFGCFGSGIKERLQTNSNSVVLELGLVLRGEPFAYCVPLDRIGIEEYEEIIQVETSCPCVTGNEVILQDSGRIDKCRGLYLRVATNDKDGPQPVRLAVSVTLKLRNRQASFVAKYTEMSVHKDNGEVR